MKALAILAAAALLEVGGDAAVRHGLRGAGVSAVIVGCALLAGYGLLVNSLSWDFSRLMGVYVAIFALVGVLIGHFIFREPISKSLGIGIALIVMGGLVIQKGTH